MAQPTEAPNGAWTLRTLKIAPMVSPGRGRGVQALARIDRREVLERCCTIELTSAQCDALEQMKPLGDFYFHHPADPDGGLVVLGLASLVNHSDRPNVRVHFAAEPGLGWIASLTALEDLTPGTELVHRYHCPPWFDIA